MTMPTDVTEKGLESLIVRAMTGRVDLVSPPHVATETSVSVVGGTGWLRGDPGHYDRRACVDLVHLRGFLLVTQPKLVEVHIGAMSPLLSAVGGTGIEPATRRV